MAGQERAHGFVDGGYLRAKGHDRLNPHPLVYYSLERSGFGQPRWTQLMRVSYYDAEPDDPAETDDELTKYFKAIERITDVECRFGYLRGKPERKARRQKAVDIQLAVDMLGRAYERLFEVAILVAGDADFVPVVHETRRRGVIVVVAGFEGTVSDLLIEEADRYYPFPKEFESYKVTI